MSSVVWLTVQGSRSDALERTLARLGESVDWVTVIVERTTEDRAALLGALGDAEVVMVLSEVGELAGLVQAGHVDQTLVATCDDRLGPVISDRDATAERRRCTREFGYRVCGLWDGTLLDGRPRICVMPRGHQTSPHRDVDRVDLPVVSLAPIAAPTMLAT